MPGVVRLNDMSRGHGCFPPKPNIVASSNVFVNNKGAVRVDDAWAVHRCGKRSHGSVSIQGSSTVFVNNKPAVRQGDALNCGDAAQECSSNVFIGR